MGIPAHAIFSKRSSRTTGFQPVVRIADMDRKQRIVNIFYNHGQGMPCPYKEK
jgi:hypothetical protein